MKSLLRLFLISLFSSYAFSVDYSNAKVTGIGIVAGENQIRFTIDKDPNVIFLTTQYSGEQLNRLVALVMAAYTAQSTIYLIRSSENSSSSTRHYTEVTIFDVGAYTFN